MRGRHLREFLANPDLRQTTIVPSACHFSEIVIDGPIIVENTFNHLHLGPILADVLYNSDSNLVIPSLKKFNSLKGKITATSALLNGKPLNRYVTTDTYQEIHLPVMCGNIRFDKLHVDGLFDFLNVTELDQNAVRLSGEQYTELDLIFEGFGGLPVKIYTNELKVQRTVNDIDVNGFMSVDESIELPGNLLVTDLNANEVFVHLGEVIDRSTRLVGWDLNRIERFAIMNGKQQTLSAAYHINTAVIKRNDGIRLLNGFNVSTVLDRLANDRSNDEYLGDARVHVRKMVVEGSVLVDHINGHHFDTIASNAIYLNRPLTTYGTLRFVDPIIVNGNLSLNLLMGKNFNEFANAIVHKDENYVIIKGNTTIDNDIFVMQHLDTAFTDGFETKLILSKHIDQTHYKSFRIHGGISVPVLNCKGSINSIDCGRFSEVYRFDYARYVHEFNANVQFNQLTYINDLRLNAGFNSIPNVTQFLGDVVRKDQYAVVKGLKTFHGTVHFDMDLKLLEHRGKDLINFFSKVLFANDGNLIQLNANIVFTDPIVVSTANVKGDLILSQDAQTDVNFDDWISNSISVNDPRNFTQPLVFGKGAFERALAPRAGFIVHHINGKSTENIVTLHTPQRFHGHVHLGEVHSLMPISVDGLINMINLTALTEDTLRVSGIGM